MASEGSLDTVRKIITPIYFSVGCLMQAVFLYRVRCRLDFSMYFISATFLAAFFFRLPFIANTKDGNSPFLAIASLLIFGLIYYFVFKMVKVKDKLESRDLKEHL